MEAGQKVKKGELIMSVSLSYIRENELNVITPIIVSDMSDNQRIRILKTGKIEVGEGLFAVDLYE